MTLKKFIKKEEEENEKPDSFETSQNEKNLESDLDKFGSSNTPKFETPETKEAERSMRERKAKIKEQKLPKKYRKGW